MVKAPSDVSTGLVAAEGYRRVHGDARIEGVPFQPELTAAALGVSQTRSDKNWSLAECPTFVVMERRSLTEEPTTNHPFE